MSTTTTATEVRIGDRRMSFEMQPLGRDMRPLNGGNHYANADTIEGARAYAARVVGKEYNGSPFMWVAGVSITGQRMEFAGYAWRPLRGNEDGFTWVQETVKAETPAPLLPRDEGLHCYDTTVMDYFETVHEIRSNGSCRCGKNPAKV